MPSYASGSAKPTQALISFGGETTSDGNAGGTTLVSSSLTTRPNFDGQQVLIMSGTYAGQVRDIDGDTTGGTVTVTGAFGGQIVSGVKFFILAILPMTEEAAAIMGTGFDTTTDSLVVQHDDHITEITAVRMAELSAANIPADVDTLLTRLSAARALLLDEITAVRLAELSAANLPADIDTLLARLTALRAGYLDNINQAGLLDITAARAALLDQITAIRMAELNAANMPADLDAVLADTGTDGVVVNDRTATYERQQGVAQVIEVSITAAANAGVTTVATVTTQPCQIESVVIHADAAQTANMTTCAVKGGASQVVTFISTTDATQANLNAADKQLGWTGAVRLAATKTIAIDLIGTGAAAVDLTITIKYRACVNGGYLV